MIPTFIGASKSEQIHLMSDRKTSDIFSEWITLFLLFFPFLLNFHWKPDIRIESYRYFSYIVHSPHAPDEQARAKFPKTRPAFRSTTQPSTGTHLILPLWRNIWRDVSMVTSSLCNYRERKESPNYTEFAHLAVQSLTSFVVLKLRQAKYILHLQNTAENLCPIDEIRGIVYLVSQVCYTKYSNCYTKGLLYSSFCTCNIRVITYFATKYISETWNLLYKISFEN